MIIKKILYNKATRQKYILLPKNTTLEAGSYVKITEVKE